MPLREHQVAPAKHLAAVLDQFGSGVDFSHPGAGKSYVASAVAAQSKLPTLVVHPVVSFTTWERAADTFGEKFSQVGYEMLRTGGTQFGKWSNGSARRERYFKCQCCLEIVDLQNYRPCYCHPKGIHCIETKTRQHDYGHFSFAPEVKQIIFDEGHRCSGISSLNADMMVAAKRQKIRTMVLTATAGCNPLHFRALGYLLDLHNLDHDLIQPFGPAKIPARIRSSFYHWASKYGCRRDPKFRGVKWFAGREQQAEIMLEIRDQIIPGRGVRLSAEDIPGFPECDIQPELYDVTSPEVFDKLYEQVREAQEALKLRKESDLAPDSPLTKITRARQEIELLKVPIAAEVGRDYLEKGFSLVLFVNYRQTIEELCKRFPEARVIDGTTASTRDADLDLFQINDIPALIVNSQAGGVSLSMQDLDGCRPRAGLVMPCYSATIMRQVFGRLPRDGGRSKAVYRVLLAQKTIETAIHRSLRAKLDNLDALNDADLNPGNLIVDLN